MVLDILYSIHWIIISSCAYTTNQTSPIPKSASDLEIASNKHAVVLALVCHSATSGKGTEHKFLHLGTLSPNG